jgi:hypothetical protein
VTIAAVLTPPLAHLGHWYVSLLVFLGPVVVLLAFVYLGDWRQKRKAKDPDERR